MYSFLNDLLSPSSDELNILSAFKPMYITLSVFGLMPYSLKLPNRQEGAIIIHKSIYFNLLCSVSIILLLYSSCVIHVQHVFAGSETSTMTEVLMTKTNYLLELLGFIIFTTVTYFCAFKNRLFYVKMINAIVSSNNSLVDQTARQPSLREIYVQVKMITGSLCLLLATQLTVNFTRHDSVWKITLVTITFILPQMIQFTLISFYYVLVLMVVGTLKNINEQLIHFVKARKINAAKSSKMEIQTVDFHLTKTVFVKMLETKREINKAFQAPILATVIQCFHSLISETYAIYHGLSFQTQTIHDIINCLTWIGYQLLKVYTISRTGILLKGQVAKIGRSLHNIPTGKKDTRLYLEIQHFSTLIMYQDAELKVYDYFPLDTTLMFNIITSAVLYLIILVQFDK